MVDELNMLESWNDNRTDAMPFDVGSTKVWIAAVDVALNELKRTGRLRSETMAAVVRAGIAKANREFKKRQADNAYMPSCDFQVAFKI